MSDSIKEKKEEGTPTVHIKMKIGSIEFEIECREDQVQEMVQKILSTVTDYTNRAVVFPVESSPPPTRAETCRDIVERIWKDSWFSEPRSLDDIHREMTRIGYHYDRTAVAHVLLDLVRDGILTREGKARRYVYIQKRPPNLS